MAERMTVAEVVVRFCAAQRSETFDGPTVPLFGGVFAIFGHGNVAGLGPALERAKDELPTYRAHNEQGMAHAAVAFAKANFRRRMMACTTSIGPGATNLVTAAATAHANRLPVLLLPGDVFATRAPDPVLQQIEDFGDPSVTANDCLKPVSRFFDRVHRPEQIFGALEGALRVLTDPVECGPATIALPQDVQTESVDVPDGFFEPRVHRLGRRPPDPKALEEAAALLKTARRPLLVAGGGALYSGAANDVRAFADGFGVPVAETQAGKSTLPADHPFNVGGIGVTGTAAANELAAEADLFLFVGTRLMDFTSASRTIFEGRPAIALNVASFDGHKHGAMPLLTDARLGLSALTEALGEWRADEAWTERTRTSASAWATTTKEIVTRPAELPSDANVIGVVNAFADERSTVVCAAGGLPGELHKLWRATVPGSYHLEYGYSCMGYEIAGGMGVKLARPDREVIVMVGDGSYLMLNSELSTSVALGAKMVVVVLDNRGFGCINRLQRGTGGEPFNNLLDDAAPKVDFVAHAAALGANAEKVSSLAELPAALERARAATHTSVVVIETDPNVSTAEGGAWWDVAVEERSTARSDYDAAKARQGR